MSRNHGHYFKNVSHLKEVDFYRIADLFGITDQAIGHAVKKLLVPGIRGAKGFRQDIQEAVDTLNRRLEMLDEDEKQGDLFEDLQIKDLQVPPLREEWNVSCNYGGLPKEPAPCTIPGVCNNQEECAKPRECATKPRKGPFCIHIFRSRLCGATNLLHLECNKTLEDCKKFESVPNFKP